MAAVTSKELAIAVIGPYFCQMPDMVKTFYLSA